jgi:hypothetical protein
MKASIYDEAISLINEPPQPISEEKRIESEEKRIESYSAEEKARKRWRLIKRELRENERPI